MESEDKQEAETTEVAQAPVGSVGYANGNQEVAAISCERRTSRACKERFLWLKCFWQCLFFGAVISIPVVLCLRRCVPCCPNEWVGYRQKCYFISEEEKNWTSSQTFCNENESMLVIFENQEEMDSLVRFLKIDDSWIGLRKNGESFYWENGVVLKEDLFQIRNHSKCAYLDGSTVSTSACSLPRRWVCVQPHKAGRQIFI